MHNCLLSMAVVMTLCAANTDVEGDGTTTLALEPAAAAPAPFHNGDCLDIRESVTGAATETRITVVDVKYWPWVCVKSARGEIWINFERVLGAKRALADR